MSLNYSGLRWEKNSSAISERLLRLRRGSLAAVREQRDDSSLLLATWNLRDFDSGEFGWGKRLDESFYYIAEVIDCFDLVALQEINRDLGSFDRLLGILGKKEWDFLLSDVTEGVSGNGERMAYLFRRDKVWFRRIAGEVVLPNGQLIVPASKVDPKKVATEGSELSPPVDAPTPTLQYQFARSPYRVGRCQGC
jgi:hypothetical protein